MADRNPDLAQSFSVETDVESALHCSNDILVEHAAAASPLRASKSTDSALSETDAPQLPALQQVFRGNAASMRAEEPQRRGWFVGEFMSHPSLRTSAVEVKFGMHAPGEARTEWGGGRYTTLAILIKGRTRIEFPDQVHDLRQEGDFVIFQPGVLHKWDILEETVTLTVRWPADEAPPAGLPTASP